MASEKPAASEDLPGHGYVVQRTEGILELARPLAEWIDTARIEKWRQELDGAVDSKRKCPEAAVER